MDLKINDRIWPLKFGFSSIIDFCRDNDFEMSDFGKWVISLMDSKSISFNDLEKFAVLVWHGIKCGCFYEKTEFTLQKVEVIDSIMDETVLIPAFNELLKSMPSNKNKDQASADKGGSKKK